MSITSATPMTQFWSAYKPYFMIILSSPPDCPLVERIQTVLFKTGVLGHLSSKCYNRWRSRDNYFTLDSEQSETAFLDYPLGTVESISKEVDFINSSCEKGIVMLFVEGSSRVHSSFINEGLADESLRFIDVQNFFR